MMNNILNSIFKAVEPAAGKILENVAINMILNNNESSEISLVEEDPTKMFIDQGAELAGRVIATSVKKFIDTQNDKQIYITGLSNINDRIYELETKEKQYRYNF